MFSRRWLRFSLQSLFIAVLVVAAFLGGRLSRQSEIERLKAEWPPVVMLKVDSKGQLVALPYGEVKEGEQ